MSRQGSIATALATLRREFLTCLFGNWIHSRVVEDGMGGCWAYNGLVGELPG